MHRSRGKGSRRAPVLSSARRGRAAVWRNRATHAVSAPEDLGPDLAVFDMRSRERPAKFIYRFDQCAAMGRWAYAADLVCANRWFSTFRVWVQRPHEAAARQAATVGEGDHTI